MASQIDICNQALSHLGDSATVSSIDPPEGSAQAEHCARFYPLALSSLLEMHPWGFATTRTALAEITNPASSWAHAYALPSDMVSLLAVLPIDAAGAYTQQDYETETNDAGDQILLTNQITPVLRYTRLIKDPGKFSPLFARALGWLLASELAGPVLKGEAGVAAAQACMKTFNYWLELAKGSDASDRRVRPQHQVPWMNAR